jgi:hypothetical protein
MYACGPHGSSAHLGKQRPRYLARHTVCDVKLVQDGIQMYGASSSCALGPVGKALQSKKWQEKGLNE